MPPARAISTAVLLSAATLLASSLTACAPTDRDGDRQGDTEIGRAHV